MSKKIDCMSEAELTGSMLVTGLPSAPVFVTDEGNAGMVVREGLEEHDGEVRSLRLRRRGVLLDPVLDDGVVRLRPGVDISSVRRIAGDPALRQAVMRVGPLRDDMRIAAGLVGLEPGLDVGRDELALLVARGVGDDRSERAGDAVAQRIVRRAIG